MALQDLTPQLRTRLSRVERAVGLFVTVATLLMIAGFVFYIYHTAQRRGWTKTKLNYSTSLNNAAGLKIGDPVTLMGFTVGEVVSVEANEPGDYYGVTVYFRVMEPYYGYIWLDSKVRVAPADFLGNRNLEILKGREMAPTVLTAKKQVTGMLNGEIVRGKFNSLVKKIRAEEPGYTEHAAKWDATNALNELVLKGEAQYYDDPKDVKPYWIEPLESPALTERLETMVNTIESGLPGILHLTNKISAMLVSANTATTNLNAILTLAKPTLTNVAAITENLTNSQGSLGEWILTPELNQQIKATLDSLQATLKTADETLNTAHATIENQDTNVTVLISNLNLSLIELAGITSNLNQQVQRNTNIVKEVSDTIVHTDELIQGLKKHWLLRSAFKTNKTDKAEKPVRKVLTSPRMTK